MVQRRNLAASAVPALPSQDKTHMFANAEAYERFMGRWSRLVAARLIDFTNIPDEGQLLDIGSGTGALSFTIAEQKARVRLIGVDPSKEYVAYANSLNPVPDRINFEIGDAQHLRFANATFGCCLSSLRQCRHQGRASGRPSQASPIL